MKEEKQFIEIGKVINTHGVRGDLKVEPWADTPDAIVGVRKIRLDDGSEYRMSARIHGRFLIAHLKGVESVEEAMKLRDRILLADRRDIAKPKDRYFVQDLLGLEVYSEEGSLLGKLTDILDYPAGSVYVVSGEREHLIPENGGFIREIDLENGRILVQTIEGM